MPRTLLLLVTGLIGLAGLAQLGHAAELRLARAAPDPYGFPRPAPGETAVPTATSLFFEIALTDPADGDRVLADSVEVRLRPDGGTWQPLLGPNGQFAEGCAGKVFPAGAVTLAVYIDRVEPLLPETTYTVSVRARSQAGAVLEGAAGAWSFTTESAAAEHAVAFSADLATEPVHWQGGFFTGFCKPSFCTSASNRIASYELMDAVRRQAPRAWSLQRDFWPTGIDHRPALLSPVLPGVVRERETRRITAVERRDRGTLLRVADFFGHEQYGIEANRPLPDDYHPGDRILVADGVHHAETEVLDLVLDSLSGWSLLVGPLDEPADGWKIDYAAPLPEKEDPLAPGLFPPGGCYLRKLRPAGTPCYYWKRLDAEWDIAVRRFSRRLVVNFADAPGDLAIDGQNWTYPKDYVPYREAVHAITLHLLDRYGDACLDFYWSVFNEPDLAAAFWRSGDWKELQKFYDYTVDGILRAFEDRGYDSARVMVGGLEIGAIFGTHIEQPILRDFLCHCSPRATSPGALPQNAAIRDPRLDGRRCRRVEQLCRATGGKGTPCDFISVHSYNAAPMMAAKLIRAKELALEVDAEYYGRLWINSFESCPNWAPPPDVAAADSYLGNGYFPTWCADVARRLVARAADDPRYALGESILTFWPWPNRNFGGANDCVRAIAVDDDGDGQRDRDATVAMPILHFLGLLADMGDSFRPLPEQVVGGHTVSGLVARDGRAVRVLLYTHHPRDTQSRSVARFKVSLELSGVAPGTVAVREYRFDKNHHSYYHPGRELRDRPAGGSRRPIQAGEADRLLADLASGDAARQIAAVEQLPALADVPQAILESALQVYQTTADPAVRAAVERAGRKLLAPAACYRPEEVEQVRRLSELQATAQRRAEVESDGTLRLTCEVAGNGANYIVVESAGSAE